MNRSNILSLVFLLSTYVAVRAQEAIINFETGNLEQLKERAAREGRPMFVHFTASWCMPCQWMENNTYQDRQLAAYINQHFYPVKMDIDEREGYRAKEANRIILLPSVLIIDTRGLVVGRYEESMNAARLFQVLQQYTPAGDTPVLAAGGPELDAPARPELIVRPALVPENNPVASSSPPRKVNTSSPVGPPVYSAPSGRMATDAPAGDSPSQYQPSSPPRRISTGMPNTDNGSLGMTSSPPRKINTSQPAAGNGPATPPIARPGGRYSIQVGVFSNYENALREMQGLKDKVGQPVKVLVGDMQGATIYRLLIGAFEQRSDAEAYLSQLKQATIIGMVKDLSEL